MHPTTGTLHPRTPRRASSTCSTPNVQCGGDDEARFTAWSARGLRGRVRLRYLARAHHDHGAVGVLNALQAHRSEKHAGEATATTMTQYQHVPLAGPIDQDTRG